MVRRIAINEALNDAAKTGTAVLDGIAFSPELLRPKSFVNPAGHVRSDAGSRRCVLVIAAPLALGPMLAVASWYCPFSDSDRRVPIVSVITM